MPRHTDRKPGWINRQRKADQKKAREQAAARRSAATTIGRGGLVVKEGGSLSSVYPNGVVSARFGPKVYPELNNTVAYGLYVNDEDGNSVLTVESAPDYDVNIFHAKCNSYFTGERFAAATLTDVGLRFEDGLGVAINGGAEGVKVSHFTTGASANTFIDPSDSRIWRSTSSQRYKQDIADLTVDPEAVLRMRPRMWRDKAQVEADPKTDTHYVGFIAEELHDLGLTAFVVYDDEDKPEAIAYDRLSAALVGLAQQQQREHDALKADVASLSQRLAALESR